MVWGSKVIRIQKLWSLSCVLLDLYNMYHYSYIIETFLFSEILDIRVNHSRVESGALIISTRATRSVLRKSPQNGGFQGLRLLACRHHCIETRSQELEALLRDVVGGKRLSASKMAKLQEMCMKSLKVCILKRRARHPWTQRRLL